MGLENLSWVRITGFELEPVLAGPQICHEASFWRSLIGEEYGPSLLTLSVHFGDIHIGGACLQ